MMMAIGLAIRGDVHELRPAPVIGKSAEQAVGKSLAVAQQPFESHRARDGSVIKKQVNAAPRRQLANIGARWVDLAAFHIQIGVSPSLSSPSKATAREMGPS